MGFDDLFGALAKEALSFVREKTGVDLTATPQATDAPAPTGTIPFGIDRRPMPAGEAVDTLVPPAVRGFARTRVNNNFGGARSGGVFAGYSVDGVEVRVLASLAPNAAAARTQIEAASRAGEEAGLPKATTESLNTEPSFSAAAGAIVWNRGPYWFSVSSHGTDGDVALPATATEVAALERFMADFPY